MCIISPNDIRALQNQVGALSNDTCLLTDVYRWQDTNFDCLAGLSRRLWIYASNTVGRYTVCFSKQ